MSIMIICIAFSVNLDFTCKIKTLRFPCLLINPNFIKCIDKYHIMFCQIIVHSVCETIHLAISLQLLFLYSKMEDDASY